MTTRLDVFREIAEKARELGLLGFLRWFWAEYEKEEAANVVEQKGAQQA
jgi:hypothetical protein